MFTCIAYSESQDAAGAFVKIAAVNDQHIKTQGDSIFVNQFNRLVGALACIGSTATGARIVSPTLRRFAPNYISPIEMAIYPDGDPHIDVSHDRVIALDIDEQLEVEAASDPAAAEQQSIVLWMADADISPVRGEIFTVKATTTVALLAGAWAFSTLSFVDDLPVGQYDVVGMKIICDEGIVARLVPIGANYRPGVPCVASEEFDDPNKTFRYGNMGVFCSFPHNNPPNIEILGSAAEASDTYNVYLDLIKR